MSSSLVPFVPQIPAKAVSGEVSRRLPAVPWTDPHSVSPEQLTVHIRSLESACEQNPGCSELRTCLGIAHAMNFDVYKSMDALEKAVEIDPTSFIAQFKYAELLYRLRIMISAEREGIKAAQLATNTLELGMAQNQLREIRRLVREGAQKPEWSKSLKAPAFALMLMIVVFSVAMYLKP